MADCFVYDCRLFPVRVNQYIKEVSQTGIDPQYQHMKND